MIRIDHLLFGYVTFKIPPQQIPTLAGRLMKSAHSAKISSDGSFAVRYSQKRKTEELLSDIEYTVSEPKGLFGALYRLRKRYGVIAALVSVLALLFLSRTVVWDIRIDGIDGEEREEVLSDLSESGLSVGSFWHKIDTSEIEAKTLLASDSVAWLNINRRGTVAYVTALPKTVVDVEDKTGVYSNIIAARDCVIEEITVKRGIALVKVGETVKAGDVLISGVIPTELGGGVCYAEGSVKGRFSDTVSHFSSATVTEKTYSGQTVGEVKLKLFKKEINIFKTYRNFGDGCDIIEKKRQLSLFGKGLPIFVYTKECFEYTESELWLDEGTLVKITSEELSLAIAQRTANSTLISIKTDGEFTDGGYLMSAEVITVGDVAKVMEFYRE